MSDLTREQRPVKIFYDFRLQQNLWHFQVKKETKSWPNFSWFCT